MDILYTNQNKYTFQNVTVDVIRMNEVAKCYDLAKKENFVFSDCYNKNKELIFDQPALVGLTSKDINLFVSSGIEPKFFQFNIRCKHGIFIQYMIYGQNPQTEIYQYSYRLYEYKGGGVYEFIKADDPYSDLKIWEDNFIFTREIIML